MTRRLINLEPREKAKLEGALRLDPRRRQETASRTGSKLDPLQVDRVLCRKRSQKYMDAIAKLDAGGHVHNQQQVEAVIAIIREEMPEIEIDMGPVGIVSKCYLGTPYEVHTLDITGGIIEHYETFRKMPGLLERARGLARSGSYAFIEVYADALRAVKTDGSVAVLKG